MQITTHQADDTDHTPQEELLDHVKHWEAGTNTDKDGDKTKGGKPIVAISGQAGIALSTPQNMTLATGTNLDLVTTQDTSITSGRSFKARAAERISLFSHKHGIKLIAASSKIEIQAQAENIEATAAKKILVIGLEEIILQSPQITHTAQGAGTTWGGGQIISKTLGKHTVHAAKHTQVGPMGVGVNLQGFPSSERNDEQFKIRTPGKKRMTYFDYKLQGAAATFSNLTTLEGRTQRVFTKPQEELKLDTNEHDMTFPAQDENKP